MEENYLLHYDSQTGNILGFYLESIHGDNIPSPTIEITSSQHDFYMQNQGIYKLDPKTLQNVFITPSLSDIQDSKIQQIQSAYNQALQSGFTSSASGTSVSYAYGESDQTKFHKLLSAYTAGLIPSYPYTVYAKDTTPILLTETQLKQLFIDIMTFEGTLEAKLHSLVGQIQACTTIDQVNEISF